MLTMQEINYVKQLLKQRKHDYLKSDSNMKDIHRHAKFTIRKLARKMATVEALGTTFRKLKEPTRENTLQMVYRADLMY